MSEATVRALQGTARLVLLCGLACPILLFAGDKTYKRRKQSIRPCGTTAWSSATALIQNGR